MQAAVRNPRWRLTNRKYLYLSLYTTNLKKSNGYTNVFRVKEFKWDISNTLWRKRQSEIQDGGSQTGNTYISACIQHTWNISTAITMFSRLRNSMETFPILCDASGNQIFKMAARKPEILISQPVINLAEKFQRRYQCFQGREIWWRHFQYCVTQAEVRNLRWRLTNRKYFYLGLYSI